MLTLSLILFSLLLADVINPVLFGGTFFTLGTRRPYGNAVAMLATYFTTYFFSGILIAVALEYLSDYLVLPINFDYTQTT